MSDRCAVCGAFIWGIVCEACDGPKAAERKMCDVTNYCPLCVESAKRVKELEAALKLEQDVVEDYAAICRRLRIENTTYQARIRQLEQAEGDGREE